MRVHSLLLLAYLVALVALAASQGGRNGDSSGSYNRGGGNGYGGHGNGNGNDNHHGHAGGRGDPIMTGFGGRSFEFVGEPGNIYSILSEKFHKVSTKLKVGVMWDHNGTYMEGFGFQYRDHQIVIDSTPDNKIAVAMNGERLQMTRGETELELIPFVEGGELLVVWQLHREGLGSAVEIFTDLIQMTIWLTPAGTFDEGGVEQPAYLNFDIALLAPPAAYKMEGIVGETYNRMLVGVEALRNPESKYYLPDDYQFHGKGSEADYAVHSYFGETATSMFGIKEHRRLLLENDLQAAFPLHATGHGLLKQAAAVKAELHASGGRKGRFF